MKEATSMLTATRCSWSLAVLLATLVNPSFGEEPLSRVQIARIGKAGTALVEIKGRGRAAYGSAFCIHPSGLFITNEHVAQGDLTLILRPGSRAEKAYKVKIVRSDKKLDLALLRIDGVKDLPTLSLGSDDKLAELMELVAVGFPFGKPPGSEKGYPSASINVGSVTALRRKDDALHRIQLDAALNPGNSGGPVLDKNGKVVGVVVSGIRGSGVNFAIPVSVLARFVARPDIHFDPPQLDPANIHKPVLFEAVVLPVLKPTTPITVELVLKAGKGKERKFSLTAAADGKYHARVVPLPPPPGGATVRLLAQFENSLLNATTADRTFKVGKREVKLSEVERIQFQPTVRVVLQDGKVFGGMVSGLEAVPIQFGEQSLPVNLIKAAAVQVGPAAKTDHVSYTLVVRQGEKEILRQNERLAVEGSLPSPAAMLEKFEEKVGEVRQYVGHTGSVVAVAFSPSGRVAVSCSEDGTVRVWNVKTGKEVRRLKGHTGVVRDVAFSPDGKRVLSGGEDKTVHVWNAETGEEVKRLERHQDRGVLTAVFSSDGRRILSGSYDRTVRLWDVESGKELKRLEGHTDAVRRVAISPDGRRALSGSIDKRVRLWDLETGQVLRTLEGHTDMVHGVAFMPDGRRAISCAFDKTIRLWDLESGKEIKQVQGPREMHDFALSGDGRRLLTASRDQTVRLWDVETGKELHSFSGPEAVNAVAFAPDEHCALSGGGGVLRLRRLPDPSAAKDKP
jgi:WD40 repeat protein